MIVALLGWLACASVEPEVPAEQAMNEAYWQTRTEEALSADLSAACRQAVAAGTPVLLRFSAPWCPDCRRMKELEQEPELARELAGWTSVVIDPGRFDRHVPLLKGLGVSRIATWVALRPPADCGQEVLSWTRLDSGIFEPASGRPWTASELSGWLAAARSK